MNQPVFKITLYSKLFFKKINKMKSQIKFFGLYFLFDVNPANMKQGSQPPIDNSIFF